MAVAPIRLTLELRLTDGALEGTAERGPGTRREFTGRLGLMQAIDALVEPEETGGPGASVDPDGPGRVSR
jgi:hypothetical protein